jgi:hypothetical protein
MAAGTITVDHGDQGSRSIEVNAFCYSQPGDIRHTIEIVTAERIHPNAVIKIASSFLTTLGCDEITTYDNRLENTK